MSTVDFAILAPVPLEHLESGLIVATETGYVSFGSDKFELFRKADEFRGDQKVPTLLYASYEGVAAKLTFTVAWTGWYIGHVEDYFDKFLDEKTHRPPTTVKHHPTGDNATGWGIFWRVEELQKLPEGENVEIRQLESFTTGSWRKDAPPRGPALVRRPEWI